MRQFKQTVVRLIITSTVVAFICAPMLIVQIAQAAPTYVSPNYGVDEVFMGAGGLNDASSTNYRARASLGDLTVGNTSSSLYQAYGGFTTTADPYIELIVNGTSTDLGYLSTSNASTTTGTFMVKAYLASGYTVVNGSDPPKATSGVSTHTLSALTSPSSSAPGTEQFGINLVANTNPVTFGADPVQLPDSSYSYGQVDSNYAVTNLYKYTKADRIAFSNKSSGTTQYTVSYLYNISDPTPAGEYVFNHVIIATANY